MFLERNSNEPRNARDVDDRTRRWAKLVRLCRGNPDTHPAPYDRQPAAADTEFMRVM